MRRDGVPQPSLGGVYERRGWTCDGVPTLETLQRLGIDSAHGVWLLARGRELFPPFDRRPPPCHR